MMNSGRMYRDNIFIVKDGVIYTSIHIGILDGITRKTVIELAREMGIEVYEKNLLYLIYIMLMNASLLVLLQKHCSY